MEVNTQFAGGYHSASSSASRTTAKGTFTLTSGTEYSFEKQPTGERVSAEDVFKIRKEAIVEEHMLTPDNIKKEDDWREMDNEQWDKLIEHIDKYIENYKEELENMEELQKEAAMKSAAEAPADMKALAASKAALRVAVNGMTGECPDVDVSYLEKLSWTYDMETDDQIILAKAKMANEFAPDMLSKSQELALFGDTTAGIGEVENAKESRRL